MGKKTGYQEWGEQKPLEHHVRLPMVGDSSVETAIEIDTGLAPGQKLGWAMVGMDICHREVAAPHRVALQNDAADQTWCCQLCRGEAPSTPVLLHPGDHDEIYTIDDQIDYNTAVGSRKFDPWRRIRKQERTQMEALYLMFGSSADITDLSLTTIELFAIIYYYLVSGPEIEGHDE